ncbi:hypothetical protein [Candidatus Binatus sp.]|uniref:hypothetical protein n=1 Tax=Candidatus Binatus sp. TaxID=2811406 RepID=UPI003C88F47A
MEVAIVNPVQTFKYQEIAEKALILRKLGLPLYKIGFELGVAGKTVLRALKWIDEAG